MKTPLILALITATSLPLASAQEERKPENPPRPADAGRPHERRPDGDRPAFEQGDRRPDGDRGPGHRRPDAPNPEGRKADGDRRDGQRFEVEIQGAPGRDRPRGQGSAGMARTQKPTAYLGVVTAAVPPSLAAQLGLVEGFGLVVDEVVPDGPAAKAGVQRFDVLKLLNDQQLVAPNQLATLVRSVGKDADVSLTIIRKGGEQKLNAKVGERQLPERRPLADVDHLMRNLAPMRERAERGTREMQERVEKWKGEFGDKMKEYNERMKDYGNRMREFHDRAAKERPTPGAPPPQPPAAPEPPPLLPPAPVAPPHPGEPRFQPAPADVLKQVRPGGAPGARVEQDGNVTVWNTANAHVVMKTDAGEMELRSVDGQRTVTARGPDGAVTFTGPIDTEEQRAALPEAVRRQLERLDVRSAVRVGGTSTSASVDLAPEVIAFGFDTPAPEDEREVQ